MIQVITKTHNEMVRGVRDANWIIIQSAPKIKSKFLQGVLKEKYPDYSFAYLRLTETDFQRSKVGDAHKRIGVLLEAKHLKEKDLPLFDRYIRRYAKDSVILILSPETYQLLRKRRKKSLQDCSVTISDIKNLDYLIHIPRLIEDVVWRDHLKRENERLRALIDQCRPDERTFSMSPQEAPAREMTENLIEKTETKRGIQIRVRGWKDTKNDLGDLGQAEFADLLTRSITSTIRNSDRVLRVKEDEFLVFLPRSDEAHVKQCIERLRASLKEISISSNERPLEIPFTLKSFEGNPLSS